MYGIISYRSKKGLKKQTLSYTFIEPLLPLLNIPLIEYQLDLFKKHGISNIIIVMDKISNQINKLLDSHRKNVNVCCFDKHEIDDEKVFNKIVDRVGIDPFFVMDGSVFTDINISYLLKLFVETSCDCVLALKRPAGRRGLFLKTTHDNRLVLCSNHCNYEEKTAAGGIGVYDSKTLKIFLKHKWSPGKEFYKDLMQNNRDVRGLVLKGNIYEITNPNDYLKANIALLSNSFNSRLVKHKIIKGIFIEDKVKIAPGAVVISPSMIGEKTKIKEKATIGPYAVIGKNCTIEEASRIEEAVIMNHSIISKNVMLRRCIVDNLTKI
jgi:mannose-1-phosphate guanylyltransferase/phosphomannomutase